jgi:hypothetical protein
MLDLKSFWKQFKSLIPTFLIIYVPVILIFGSLALLTWKANFNPWLLTADPLAVCRAPIYIGAVSNLGILLWCASASICLFCFALLRNNPDQRKTALFFLFSGLIISILMLDDFFQLHEKIYRDTLGIPEAFVVSVYGVLFLANLVAFRKVILKTDFLLLFLAFGFFGLSLLFDLIMVQNIHGKNYREIYEEGPKLLGLISWTAYFIRAALQLTRPALIPGPGDKQPD